MAKTALERKKEQLERDEAKAKQTAHVVDAFFSRPFDQWLTEDGWHNKVIYDLDLAGFDNFAPFPGQGNVDPFWREDFNEGPNRGAIGFAERAVGVFLDAAVELASQINAYKTEEISSRIAELEASDLSDPEARKRALADIVTLTRYRDQLSKQVRWSLPQWRVKGD